MVAGLTLFSPNTLRDYTLTQTRDSADDAMLDPDVDDRLAGLTFGERRPDDPEQTLVHADLAALPPTFIDVAGAEALLDDALVFARAAARAGVRVSLEVTPGLFHMRQLWAGHFDAADVSLRRAAGFVREVAGGGSDPWRAVMRA